MHHVWTYRLAMVSESWMIGAILLCVIMLGKWAVAWLVRWGFVLDASASSTFGDALLIIAFSIGFQVVANGAPIEFEYWKYPATHIAFAAIALAVGVMLMHTTHGMRHATAPDFYHDIVVVPFILYLALALYPTLWHGTWVHIVCAHICVLGWLLMVRSDFAAHRIDQQTWFRTEGLATMKQLLGPELFK